jgi:cell wall assembly regulator SMI1
MKQSPGSAIRDFTTWEPLLRLIRDENAETLAFPDSHLQGAISDGAYSVPTGYRRMSAAERTENSRRVRAVVQPVKAALEAEGMHRVSFKAQFTPDGHVTLSLMIAPPRRGQERDEAAITRVAGSLPGPYRRLPVPSPQAVPHPSADPAALQRLVREQYPHVTAATEEEIAAAEARIGMPLPEELKALYRVTRGPGYQDAGATMPDMVDEDGRGWSLESVLWEIPLPIDQVRIADPSLRHPDWFLGAKDVAMTPPGAAVQQLAGSPGWIVFGDDHAAFYYAIDMTPGDGGHVGQVIGLSIDESIGATLMARSLTAFLQGDRADDVSSHPDEELATAVIFEGGQAAVDAAAHPALEVLTLSSSRGMEPVSLAAFAGLPRLRTLVADPGMLASPLEVEALANLEYLALGPAEWRVLLDAGAVPPNLQAASISSGRGNPVPQPQPDPVPFVTLRNEIAALWNRPQITITVSEGDLT